MRRDVNPNTGKLGGFASYDVLVLFESFKVYNELFLECNLYRLAKGQTERAQPSKNFFGRLEFGQV